MADNYDNLGEWVDLSVDDFASIGEFIMNAEDGSINASFEEVYEDEEEGGQQVIQIDVSTPSLPIDSSMMKKLEDKISSLTIENENLIKANLEQKELMKEWRDSENLRFARETELASKNSKLIAEKAEVEINKLKFENLSSEAMNTLELNRYKERAETAEALVEALRHELSGCQSAFKGECELAVEKAVAVERAQFAKESKQSEQLTNDLMLEIAELRSGLNKSMQKQNNMKRSTSQGEARIKRELEQCRTALEKSEASYVELLKTLDEANKEGGGSSRGYEDRAVLGQALREANRALALVDGEDDDSDENQNNSLDSATSASGGGGGGGGGNDLSKSVLDVIGNEVSPSDAALSVRKLSEALTKAHSTKIAIERFHVGEVAMFFPIPKKGQGLNKKQEYVAFSAKRNKDKHFLADESKQLIGKSQHFKEAYVLGRVVHKELMVADESTQHLSLKPGTKYYSVTVSALPFD